MKNTGVSWQKTAESSRLKGQIKRIKMLLNVVDLSTLRFFAFKTQDKLWIPTLTLRVSFQSVASSSKITSSPSATSGWVPSGTLGSILNSALRSSSSTAKLTAPRVLAPGLPSNRYRSQLRISMPGEALWQKSFGICSVPSHKQPTASHKGNM